MKLGVEYQLTGELPASDPWRQQVEAAIDAHPAPVPMTAALVQVAINDRPPGVHRWRRRQLRAVRRARLSTGAVALRTNTVAARRRQRVLLRVAPVAAALMVGYAAGPLLHSPPAPPTPAGRVVLQGGWVAPADMPVLADSVLTPEEKQQIKAYMDKLHKPSGR